MSVFKRPGSETYSYDFRLGGRRFSGHTGAKTRREAERAEERVRALAKVEVRKVRETAGLPMTFEKAAAQYWSEVGQHLKGGNADGMLWSLDWLKRHIGAGRQIREIDDRIIATVVAIRRGEHSASGQNRKRRKPAKEARLVSPATVNRTVIEPLRQILNRARLIWKEPIAEIAWKTHTLKEPRERVRELKAEEEAKLFAVLRDDYHPILRFALLTGLRLSEIPRLRWDDIDWGGRQITVLGKGNKLATIPMPPDLRDLLWPLRQHHDDAVFTYEAARTRGDRERGQRYPITRSGLQIVFRRAISAAKIQNFRFHDTRHTAATRALRAGGNMKIVQQLLRHEDITTTAKYAHVQADDVMQVMQRASERAKLDQAKLAAESQQDPTSEAAKDAM